MSGCARKSGAKEIYPAATVHGTKEGEGNADPGEEKAKK
jgi:hypothetical protein